MTIVLSNLLGEEALVYLDDIIVFIQTIDEHYQRLDHVIDRLMKANLKLKLSKCQFFHSYLVYLVFY